jgi:hypothetical protein
MSIARAVRSALFFIWPGMNAADIHARSIRKCPSKRAGIQLRGVYLGDLFLQGISRGCEPMVSATAYAASELVARWKLLAGGLQLN